MMDDQDAVEHEIAGQYSCALPVGRRGDEPMRDLMLGQRNFLQNRPALTRFRCQLWRQVRRSRPRSRARLLEVILELRACNTLGDLKAWRTKYDV